MGWAHGIYGGRSREIRTFWWRNLKERYSEHPGVDGRIILKFTLKKDW
jgi:hypothetical protein